MNGTEKNRLFLPDLGLQLCSSFKLKEFYSNLTNFSIIIILNFLKSFYKLFTSLFHLFNVFKLENY